MFSRQLTLAIAMAFLGVGASSNALAQTTAPKADASQSLNTADRKFIEHAAQGGMAEVELGKLAQDRASSDQVKEFGRRMASDHGKANGDLRQIADAKGVTLPTELAAKDRRELEKLQKLSGPEFDRAYMKSMVSDHKKDVAEFKAQARSAKDPDLKKFATTALPTLQHHLGLAQSTESATRNAPTRRTQAPAPAPKAATGA